ncbi:MAG: glycerate kinase [Actinomycetaceae bacterium]|nr:glycerate kinase [Arcanobacterium sp.]MDD7505406.1 glycerate kinase [Actinomycetaceae bacterium]
MRIVLGASAMHGFTPAQVAQICSAAWRDVRPADEIISYILSDGDPMPLVGTGLESVVQSRFPDVSEIELPGSRGERLWMMDDARRVVLDLASGSVWHGVRSNTGSEGNDASCDTNNPWGSSARFSTAMHAACDLVANGAREVLVHLPQMAYTSDLGIGMLEAYSGRQIIDSGVAHAPVADTFMAEKLIQSELTAAISELKSDLSGTSLRVTYPYSLALLGFSGMAYSWINRGVLPAKAQAYERIAGAWAAQIVQAGNSVRTSLLGGDAVSAVSAYSGVGGGLGLLFDALGASFTDLGGWLLSDVNLESLGMDRLADVAAACDLMVYACGPIAVDMPGGLHAFAQVGEDVGVPVVVMAQTSGLRKGELPNLGLAAAYDVYPHEAFEDLDNATIAHSLDAAELKRREHDIARQVTHIAQTWGWD